MSSVLRSLVKATCVCPPRTLQIFLRDAVLTAIVRTPERRIAETSLVEQDQHVTTGRPRDAKDLASSRARQFQRARRSRPRAGLMIVWQSRGANRPGRDR